MSTMLYFFLQKKPYNLIRYTSKYVESTHIYFNLR